MDRSEAHSISDFPLPLHSLLLFPLLRNAYGYSRDRAVATLAILAKDEEVCLQLKQRALLPLKTMFLTTQDRWEKRDAATALLKLFTQVSFDLNLFNSCDIHTSIVTGGNGS